MVREYIEWKLKEGLGDFMLRINQVKLRAGHSEEDLRRQAASTLRIPVQNITELRAARQSIDARKKPEIFYSYALDVSVRDEEKILHRFRGKENLVCKSERAEYHFPASGKQERKGHVIIVGTGPAGLFCGYFLALHGYRPVLLERGRCVEERQKDVERFWETGKLDTVSNVQFGEGGAGTFSDGKLNTLVKDKDGRNRAVLETFVRFGAKESICYDAKPHIGTDVLCTVVKRMREEIIRLGGEVRFESRLTDIRMEAGRVTGVTVAGPEGSRHLACGQLVLAIGHSARDTFSMLEEREVPMEAKAFAVGLRVEHPQGMINRSQYGLEEPGDLGAAPYKVTAKARNGRGVYSFCMCPGGYVVNASSEEGRTAVNGMSYSGRNGKNANSAIIVTVAPEDFGSDHPLAGIAFQRRLEEKAYALGGGKIPVQRYGDFKRCVEQERCGIRQNLSNGQSVAHCGDTVARREEVLYDEALGGKHRLSAVEIAGSMESMDSGFGPQCKGMYTWADVSCILPKACNEAIVEGMEAFGRQIAGFDRPDACLSGVESRTSSPVRICRDESLQSKIRGLYPCGEGAGYAGGIVSAAMDGIRVAEAIAREYAP